MQLNFRELEAITVIATHHFPKAVSVDIDVLVAVGGLGYVKVDVREADTPRRVTAYARYLVNPSGRTFVLEVDRASGGFVTGDEVLWS